MSYVNISKKEMFFCMEPGTTRSSFCGRSEKVVATNVSERPRKNPGNKKQCLAESHGPRSGHLLYGSKIRLFSAPACASVTQPVICFVDNYTIFYKIKKPKLIILVLLEVFLLFYCFVFTSRIPFWYS